jgi:tRNA(Ile)-lysidine synthase
MLKNKQLLKNSKNLLAFSGGGDSTALLFLLLQNNIKFDIAIVDYNLRLQSKEEVNYAQVLAKEYGFQCFVHSAEHIDSNFEAKARSIRYDFFESIILKHKYANLLTAHHLGDRFEWMLMQFCKGAGCVELSGMQELEQRKHYKLVRPLLSYDKVELLNYLHEKQIKYFEDETNADESYKRNYFRHNFSQPLLEKYSKGIKQSFHYLEEDTQLLSQEIHIQTIGEFAYFKSINQRSDLVAIDKYFKSKNKLLTAQEKELLKKNATYVIGRKYVVTQEHSYVMIAPYIKVQMSKKFKEKMRILQVDPKLRGYIATHQELEELLSSLLS